MYSNIPLATFIDRTETNHKRMWRYAYGEARWVMRGGTLAEQLRRKDILENAMLPNWFALVCTAILVCLVRE